MYENKSIYLSNSLIHGWRLLSLLPFKKNTPVKTPLLQQSPFILHVKKLTCSFLKSGVLA